MQLGKVHEKPDKEEREGEQTGNDIDASYNCCLSSMIYTCRGGINN